MESSLVPLPCKFAHRCMSLTMLKPKTQNKTKTKTYIVWWLSAAMPFDMEMEPEMIPISVLFGIYLMYMHCKCIPKWICIAIACTINYYFIYYLLIRIASDCNAFPSWDAFAILIQLNPITF